jgi:S-adenosylmethionine:tRNA ribosyltransferase-isomerase
VRRRLLDYDLPPELIADRPPEERDGARLLVIDGDEPLQHRRVRDLDALVDAGALLVVNDTRVIPARLLGHKEDTGGKAEIFLVRDLGEDAVVEHAGQRRPGRVWSVLARPLKSLRPGTTVLFDSGLLAAQVRRILPEEGQAEVVVLPTTDLDFATALERTGHVPLPPYVRRPDEAADRERYQTIFARVPGAVAAPTAGLHLSPALVERLRARGVQLATVTLHVGLGTFEPVTVDDLDDHPMHAEILSVPPDAAAAVTAARSRGAPVIAVGTTVVRALESAADPERPGHVRPRAGETRLLIQPGFRFRVVDQLLTNFHLPQSTLLALVAAFAGRERVLAAYGAAVEERYRFFSYGDAMFLRRREVA